MSQVSCGDIVVIEGLVGCPRMKVLGIKKESRSVTCYWFDPHAKIHTFRFPLTHVIRVSQPKTVRLHPTVRPVDISLNRFNLIELVNCIQAGKKIQAIKYFRAITGLGLKEAKDIIELNGDHVGKNAHEALKEL